MRRAFLLAALAACGGDKAREPKTHHVEIRGMKFVPAELVVAVGDTVEWTNVDIVPHTVTSASFDSQQMASKAVFQYKLMDAGEYAYRCTLHPTMFGKLTVR